MDKPIEAWAIKDPEFGLKWFRIDDDRMFLIRTLEHEHMMLYDKLVLKGYGVVKVEIREVEE